MLKLFVRCRLSEGGGRRAGAPFGTAAAVMLAALLFSGVSPHGAQGGDHTHSWTGAGVYGVWNDADNWDKETYPDGDGHVVLISMTDHDITVPAGMVLGGLVLDGDYSGTVTLAGDLTINDEGDLTVNAGTLQTGRDVESGIEVGGAFTIGSNGTVVVRRSSTTANDGNGAGQAVSAGDMVVDGRLHADLQGFDAGQGPASSSGRSGASHGGTGGYGTSGTPGDTYGSVTDPVALGSGGSGPGGGAICLTVDGVLEVNGTVSAEGAGFTGTSRGGSGGSIKIRAGSVSGSGSVMAGGGQSGGVSGAQRGAGGGGRVAVKTTEADSFDGVGVSFLAYGGPSLSGMQRAAAGTVYLEHAGHAEGRGELIVDNDNAVLAPGGSMPDGAMFRPFTELSEGGDEVHKFSMLTIRNRGNLSIREVDTLDFAQLNLVGDGVSTAFLTVSHAGGITFPDPFVLPVNCTLNIDVPVEAAGDWTIPAGAVLSHNRNYDLEMYKLDLFLDGNLVIDGGEINTYGSGYLAREGPGGGIGRAGGSYGGVAGLNEGSDGVPDTIPVGPTYGSALNPVALGSGGGDREGGGAVILTVSGLLVVNGDIIADGADREGDASTGGSGGSINIRAGYISGDGVVRANGGRGGGTAGTQRAAGGGGRVAVRLTHGAGFDDVAFEARGNLATRLPERSAAGTVYLQHAVHAEGTGELIVRNTHVTNVEDYGTVTQLPAALDTELYVDELRTVTLIVEDEGVVGLTADITVGDLIFERND